MWLQGINRLVSNIQLPMVIMMLIGDIAFVEMMMRKTIVTMMIVVAGH